MVSRCLEEDGAGHGDVTSTSILGDHAIGKFELRTRTAGVLCGLHVITRAMHLFGDVQLHTIRQDGEKVDGMFATIEGAVRSILLAERTILNILGYASGIATQTSKFVEALRGTHCVVCDTRKTTPGLRILDKYAVGCGGGTLHRLGLHDAALYKDNHISGVPIEELGVTLGNAIEKARNDRNLAFVEVEVDSLQQLQVVLTLDVDIVLLDNMPPAMLQEAVLMRDTMSQSTLLEASGGITIDIAREIAQTGVDRIAVGGLVHRSHWLDIGLDATDA